MCLVQWLEWYTYIRTTTEQHLENINPIAFDYIVDNASLTRDLTIKDLQIYFESAFMLNSIE